MRLTVPPRPCYRPWRDDARGGMPEPVATKHPAANDLISGLRVAAKEIKSLGDECIRLQRELDAARYAGSEDREAVKALSDELDTWRELLVDFRSGIRDGDELLDKTIGRR